MNSFLNKVFSIIYGNFKIMLKLLTSENQNLKNDELFLLEIFQVFSDSIAVFFSVSDYQGTERPL